MDCNLLRRYKKGEKAQVTDNDSNGDVVDGC